MEPLEICVDASLKEIDGRKFGCSGAYCINNNMESYMISPDTTNNRSELLAIYIGIKLAEKIFKQQVGMYSNIIIYSDSQFGVYGLTKWIHNWIGSQDRNGVFFGSNNKPVMNQELFKAIYVKLYHQQGHVKYTSTKSLNNANKVFYNSNGFYLKPEDIYKISYYNDLIDNKSRNKLNYVRSEDYPFIDYHPNINDNRIGYKIPPKFYQYIS